MKPEKRIWAPLVHGRTYEVDYRSNLLAVPEWFSATDLAWAMPFIQGTFDSFLVKGLPEPVHWSMFKNERYCVVGLTCLAHQVSEDMNRDIGNRVLPVFLGYICKEVHAPILPKMEIGAKSSEANPSTGQFSELYRFVRNRWHEKRQSNQLTPVKETFELEVANYELSKETNGKLNLQPEQTALWPISHPYHVLADDQRLWSAASHYPGPVSLCMGLSRQSTAVAGPFLNATAYDVQRVVTLPKPVKEPIEQAKQPAEESQTASARKQSFQNQRPTSPYGESPEPERGQSSEGRYSGLMNLGRKLGHIAGHAQNILRGSSEAEYYANQEVPPSSHNSPTSDRRRREPSTPPNQPRYDWQNPEVGQGTEAKPSKSQRGLQGSGGQAKPASSPASGQRNQQSQPSLKGNRDGSQVNPNQPPIQHAPPPKAPVPKRKRDWFGTETPTSDSANTNAKEKPEKEKQGKPDWFGTPASPQPTDTHPEDAQPQDALQADAAQLAQSEGSQPARPGEIAEQQTGN